MLGPTYATERPCKIMITEVTDATNPATSTSPAGHRGHPSRRGSWPGVAPVGRLMLRSSGATVLKVDRWPDGHHDPGPKTVRAPERPQLPAPQSVHLVTAPERCSPNPKSSRLGGTGGSGTVSPVRMPGHPQRKASRPLSGCRGDLPATLPGVRFSVWRSGGRGAPQQRLQAFRTPGGRASPGRVPVRARS